MFTPEALQILSTLMERGATAQK